MKKKLLFLSVFTLFITWMGCKKAFNPETLQGFKSTLIVEGVINMSGVTNINLSRTQDLDDKLAIKPELKANVQVVSESNVAVALQDKGNGLYSIPQLTLNAAQKYRLKIKTAAGQEYQSELLTVKATPAIDNLSWVNDSEGIGIYVDAHDSQNNTKYYRWDYEENWELRSNAEALYKIKALPNGKAEVVARDPKEIPLMFTCYSSGRSTNIDIFSTNNLKEDVVSKHRVVYIPLDSEKIGVRYSILLKQYAISFEAFEYLSMMKKNSEQLGSFFDSQPSELVGNIININDPKDIAVGFIGISSIVEKRIFINRSEIPNLKFKLKCEGFDVKNDPDSLNTFLSEQHIPVDPITNLSGSIIFRWIGLEKPCVDCRTRGGNNDKPSFW